MFGAGIPKFYRWLSERYPLLNQKLTLTEGPPEIDNLYLDMNGIIHNCTHANRKDIGGVTEEDMMLKVFDYLEKLVQIVRPQKLLFMAIDGGFRSIGQVSCVGIQCGQIVDIIRMTHTLNPGCTHQVLRLEPK